MIFSYIFTLSFILIIFFCLVKPKIGFSLFIVYFLLVPIIKLQLGAFSIGEKFLFLFISLSYIVRNYSKIRRISIKPLKPFIFLYASLLLLTVFQDPELFSTSIENLLIKILNTILFPLSLYYLMKLEPNSIPWIKNSILVSGLVIVLYGLFLTTMPGVNPYLMITLPMFGLQFNEAYALGHSALNTQTNLTLVDGRMFGRISSVFSHPMQYGLVLSFLSLFIFFVLRGHKNIKVSALILILVAILTSGIRSPLGAIIVAIMFLLYKLGKIKYLFYVLLGIIGVFFIVQFISEDMANYVSSIFIASDESSVKGSSFDMRFEQLLGCFGIIRESPLVGNGYSWTNIYMAKYTIHPVLLAFESLIFVVLCNTGIIGVFIWSIFVIKCLKYISSLKNKIQQLALYSLFITYLAYSCITGEYNYMKYFMVFYILTNCYFEKLDCNESKRI